MSRVFKNALYVSNLSWRTASKELRDYFGNFGKISRVFVQMDKMRGKSLGSGFVHFQHEESLDAVLEQREHFIDDNKINVSISHGSGRNDR